MNYHTPVKSEGVDLPPFMQRNGELVVPKALYRKAEYPKLPSDMVKIVSRDGRNIFVPLTKLQASE